MSLIYHRHWLGYRHLVWRAWYRCHWSGFDHFVWWAYEATCHWGHNNLVWWAWATSVTEWVIIIWFCCQIQMQLMSLTYQCHQMRHHHLVLLLKYRRNNWMEHHHLALLSKYRCDNWWANYHCYVWDIIIWFWCQSTGATTGELTTIIMCGTSSFGFGVNVQANPYPVEELIWVNEGR